MSHKNTEKLNAAPALAAPIRSTPCSELAWAYLKALMAESRQLFASRYQPWLPTEAELTRDRALLELARGGEGAV